LPRNRNDVAGRSPVASRPARKPGSAYGRRACLAPPSPDQIDERDAVPLPSRCPHCGGERIERTEEQVQYQQELPEVRPIWRELRIQTGRCSDCGRTVRGRLLDHWLRGEVSAEQVPRRGEQLKHELLCLVGEEAVRGQQLARFLLDHQDSGFAFSSHPRISASKGRAERASRPAVVNRKVWGGNRTWRGTEAQRVLMSVSHTCVQRGLSPLRFLHDPLTSPNPLLVPAPTR